MAFSYLFHVQMHIHMCTPYVNLGILTLSLGFKVPMTVLAASLAVLILLSVFMESDRSIMITMSLGTGVDVSTYHGL